MEETTRDERELVQFVGRQTEREWIKTKIKQGYRLIQVHGQGMVGKMRLCRQVVLELNQEREGDFNIVHISCLDVRNWQDFLKAFHRKCFRERSDTVSVDEIIVKSRETVHEKKSLVILVTNCERLEGISEDNSSGDFEKFVLDYLRECTNVTMLVTSQKRFHFECSSEDILIQPFRDSDTVTLLQLVLRGIDILPYKEVIIEHCYGLPPYILDAAACLKNNINLGMTPDDLRECLRNENRSKRIHGNHHPMRSEELFPGLTKYLQQKVIDLSIFRGSFGMDSFAAVIGGVTLHNSQKAKQDLYALQQYSVITNVGESGRCSRMRLTEYYSYLNSVLSQRVTYNDMVRLRFVMFFGEILSRANVDLYISSQQTVYGYLKDDWLNLEQVLKEAIHCTENTFDAFMKVATDADNLIIKCFPTEAMCFYETMSEVTEMYGTYEDKAVLEAKLGRVITQTKGDGLEKAMRLFEEALDVLEGTGASKELVALYQDVAYNHYKRGQYQESLRRCKNALETAKMMKLTPQLTNQIIGVRSLLAIPHIFLGHFTTAEALLEETLDLAKQVTPFHPSISVMINSIGLLYERSEKDDDLALQFYRASLLERKKFENMFPADLVIALNNVGMQYSKRGQHRQALKHLEEAYLIRQRLGKMDFNTALTLWHMGRVNMLLCDLSKASNLLNEAVHIYNKCARRHSVHIHVRLVQAHCYILQERHTEAQACLLETLDYTEDLISQTPKAVHLLLVLGHLLMLVQSDEILLMKILTIFKDELERFITANNGKVSQEIHLLSFGCQDCIHAIKAGQSRNFDFLQHVYKPCFVCKDLEEVGYKNKCFWNQATLSMKSNKDFITLLMSSAVLKAATSEEAFSEEKHHQRFLPSENTSDGDSDQECRTERQDFKENSKTGKFSAITPSNVFQQILDVSREKSSDLIPKSPTIEYTHRVPTENGIPPSIKKNIKDDEYLGSTECLLTVPIQKKPSVIKTDKKPERKSSPIESQTIKQVTVPAKQGMLGEQKASSNKPEVKQGMPAEQEVSSNKPEVNLDKESSGKVDVVRMEGDDLEYGLGENYITSISHGNCILEDLVSKVNIKNYSWNAQNLDVPCESSKDSGSTDKGCQIVKGINILPEKEHASDKENLLNECLIGRDLTGTESEACPEVFDKTCKNCKTSDSFEMLQKSGETSESEEIYYEVHLRNLQEERFHVLMSSRELRSTDSCEGPPIGQLAGSAGTGSTGEGGYSTKMTFLSTNVTNNLNKNLGGERKEEERAELSPNNKNNFRGKNVPYCIFENESPQGTQESIPHTSVKLCHGDNYQILNSGKQRSPHTFNLPTFLDSSQGSDWLTNSSDEQSLFGFGEVSGLQVQRGGREPLENDDRGS